MEKERKQNPLLDDDTIDRYLQGDLSDTEEREIARIVSSSRRAAKLVMDRAAIAARLALLYPAAHREAYRQEEVRTALDRMSTRENLRVEWKDRLGNWMEALSAPFREISWATRDDNERTAEFESRPYLNTLVTSALMSGRDAQTAERRVRLTPTQRNVLIKVDSQNIPIRIEIEGWSTAPLIAVVRYMGQEHEEWLVEADQSGGTDQAPIFHTLLSALKSGEYLVSAEPHENPS